MKSSSVKLGVILIGLLILGNAEAWGADWKIYETNDYGNIYYDAESITRVSKNIVRVWEMHDYTEAGITDMVETFGNKYKNLDKVISLGEINCLAKKTTAFASHALF